MLSLNDPVQRRLATQVVVFVTCPPRTLSAYTERARRLGETPERQKNQDLWNYLNHFLDLRFELAQDKDSVVAELAQNNFSRAFLERYLPADQFVEKFAQYMDWQTSGKIPESPIETRNIIHFCEKRFIEAQKRDAIKENAEKWARELKRMAELREKIENANFPTRLKLVLGRSFGDEGEEQFGKLAVEAINTPELMSENAFLLLNQAGAINSYRFLTALGTFDINHRFEARLESEARDFRGGNNLGWYHAGLASHSSAFVEAQLDLLMDNPGFCKDALLSAMQMTGPTGGNRRRLQNLIARKQVASETFARVFNGGRWLDNLPTNEVRSVFEYIALCSEDWPKLLVPVISTYLHPQKKLALELIPIAVKALLEIESFLDDSLHWECCQVAVGIGKSDLSRAFELFSQQLAALASSESSARWIPLSEYGGNDFWEFLRKNNPEKAYRSLLSVRCTRLKDALSTALDLEKDCEVLLKICKESEASAEFVASLLSGTHPGFFHFAYGLMNLFPLNTHISHSLESAALYGVRSALYGDDSCIFEASLKGVENELISANTPVKFLPWLEGLKSKVRGLIKSAAARQNKYYHLGWD